MKIEKVSKYIPVITGTSGGRTVSGSSIRQMLLSIPRVKWLEGGETEFYHKYSPPGDNPQVQNSAYSNEWCEKIKKEPFTERETIVEQMLINGATFKQIAERIGLQPGSVASYVARVRIKRAYLNQKA